MSPTMLGSAGPSPLSVNGVNENRPRGHERRAIQLGLRIVEAAEAPRHVSRIAHVAGAKRGSTGRRAGGQPDVRPKAAVVLVVVALDDDRAVRQLGLEVVGVGGTIKYATPEPRLFSFNNPFGACPTCQGFGNTIGLTSIL